MENLKVNQKKVFSKNEHLIYKSIFKLNSIIKLNRNRSLNIEHRSDSDVNFTNYQFFNQKKKDVSFETKLLKLKFHNKEFYDKLNKISEFAGIIYSEKYLEGYLEEHHVEFENLLK